MQRKLPVLLVAIMAIGFGAELLAQVRNETGVCRIYYRLVNRNRTIVGHNLNAECSLVPLFAHSSPYGNWGVESNEDEPRNSRQFDGWKLSDGFWQWNSCTSNTTAFPTGCSAPPGGWPSHPFPHSDEGPFYNSSNCQNQFSNNGLPDWDIHAGHPTLLSMDVMVSCQTGCLDAVGCLVGINDHFMKTFELDSPGSDVMTAHLTFGNQSAVADCSSEDHCSGSLSTWKFDDDPSTGVSAEAAIEIVYGEFINLYGYCQP